MSAGVGFSNLSGRIDKDHEDFDRHSRGWNLTQKHDPDLIVLAESRQDIVDAIAHASANGLGVATQCTGHNPPKPVSNAVLIRTANLNKISVDPTRKTAAVQCGALMGQLTEATHDHCLMPLTGSSHTVGVGGYLLGGGFPLLAREFGVASDTVTQYRIALASGEIVKATETEHADLFWALQGGGGAFGVLLEAEMKLIDGHTLYGGNAIFDYSKVDEILPAWLAHSKEIPEHMSTTMSIMHMPPLPFVPEPLRGKSVLFYTACVQSARPELDEHFGWAKFNQPMMADFSEMPCIESAKICRDPVDPVPASGRAVLLRDLDNDGLQLLIDTLRPSGGPPWYLKAELRKLGGAVKKPQRSSPLTLQRGAEYLLFIAAPVHPGNPIERVKAGMDNIFQKMTPWTLCQGPLGFLPDGQVTADMVKDCYTGDDYTRLREIKAKYDPNNLFRFAGVGIE